MQGIYVMNFHKGRFSDLLRLDLLRSVSTSYLLSAPFDEYVLFTECCLWSSRLHVVRDSFSFLHVAMEIVTQTDN
jgi:hypothetical protein